MVLHDCWGYCCPSWPTGCQAELRDLVLRSRPFAGRDYGQPRRSKLLLVEDNEMNRDMLSRRLTKRVLYGDMAVDDLRRAWTPPCDQQPDLILLDMSLPVLDGWAAAGILKGDPTTKQIPIIALTAHALAGDREKALEAGCEDYDTKPVDLARLIGKIEALLTGS